MGIQNNHLPLDIVTRVFNKVSIILACVDVHLEGDECIQELVREHVGVLAMFQHASNLDGFVISSVSPVFFKWIGKESCACLPADITL